MPISTHTLTAEEFRNMPDNGGRNELMRGELREMSPPSFRHGELIVNIGGPLRVYVRRNRLGRVAVADPGFILARKPDVVLAPDIAFISLNRLPPEPAATGWWELVPDLVVEVVSPTDTVYRVEEKVEDWLTFGCRMVVVVSDRRRTVSVHRPGKAQRILRGDEILDGEDVLPGFQLPLPEIFA